MDKETMRLLIENGVVMAALILSTILIVAGAIGTGIWYFTRRTEDGTFALKKHSASLEAKRMEFELNKQLQLKGSNEIHVPYRDNN
jgi:hypothetical protein